MMNKVTALYFDPKKLHLITFPQIQKVEIPSLKNKTILRGLVWEQIVI